MISSGSFCRLYWTRCLGNKGKKDGTFFGFWIAFGCTGNLGVLILVWGDVENGKWMWVFGFGNLELGFLIWDGRWQIERGKET